MPTIKYNKTKHTGIYSYKTSSGVKYHIRLRYKNSFGEFKEKSKSGFSTITQAKMHKAELHVQIKNDLSIIESSNLTFKQWYEEYLDIKSQSWSLDNEHRIVSLVNSHLAPAFNNRILNKLTPRDMQNFINQKFENGYALSTVKSMHKTMMAIINSAVEHERLTKNKLKKVTFPDNISEAEKQKYIEPDKMLLLDVYIKENFSILDQAMFILAKIGWRRGEVAGFVHGGYKEIDINTIDVAVMKSRTNKTKNIGGKPPKTKSSYRTNRITGESAQIIKKVIELSKEIYSNFNLEVTDRSFVFIHPKTGKIQNIDRLAQILNDCNKEFDIHITPHKLRHTFATNSVNSKMPPADVAKWLGHSKIDVTLNTYSHSSNQSNKEMIDFVSNM